MDIQSLILPAFEKVFGKLDFKKNSTSNKPFVAYDYKPGIQWNIDYDPEDDRMGMCVKTGINIEQKQILTHLCSDKGIEKTLTKAIKTVSDGIITRVYQTNNRSGREETIFEKQANQANVTEMIKRIQSLLNEVPYPKPHLHIYKIIWTQGQPQTRSHLVKGIETTKTELEEVMKVLAKG